MPTTDTARELLARTCLNQAVKMAVTCGKAR
jgi:hypothetical protein